MALIIPKQDQISVEISSDDFPFEKIEVFTPSAKVSFDPESAEALCFAILSAKREVGCPIDSDWLVSKIQDLVSPKAPPSGPKKFKAREGGQ